MDGMIARDRKKRREGRRDCERGIEAEEVLGEKWRGEET